MDISQWSLWAPSGFPWGEVTLSASCQRKGPGPDETLLSLLPNMKNQRRYMYICIYMYIYIYIHMPTHIYIYIVDTSVYINM